MAHRGAAHLDASGQVPSQVGNSEERRDEAGHQMVAVHWDELEISGLAEEDRQQVAALLNLFRRPTRELLTAQQRQDVALQAHLADRVLQAEA